MMCWQAQQAKQAKQGRALLWADSTAMLATVQPPLQQPGHHLRPKHADLVSGNHCSRQNCSRKKAHVDAGNGGAGAAVRRLGLRPGAARPRGGQGPAQRQRLLQALRRRAAPLQGLLRRLRRRLQQICAATKSSEDGESAPCCGAEESSVLAVLLHAALRFQPGGPPLWHSRPSLHTEFAVPTTARQRGRSCTERPSEDFPR